MGRTYRWGVLPACLAVVCAGGVLSWAAGEGPAGDTCVVKLTAPDGATVTVDGRPQGTKRTFTFAGLQPGKQLVARLRIRFPQGGEAQRVALLKGGQEVCLAARQPSRIVFQHDIIIHRDDPLDDETSSDGLFQVNPDGSDLRRLTKGRDYRPRISPDGCQIVFERWGKAEGASEERLEVWVVDADGSHARRLQVGFSPAWSPDGSRIAFVRGDNNGNEIWVMSADGADLRRLTDDIAKQDTVDWSPDGLQMVYDAYEAVASSAVPGLKTEKATVWVMNADGSGLRALCEGSLPRWSPDGRQIGFSSGWDQLFVMDADGSRPRRLDTLPEATLAKKWWCYFFAWSPDGSQLAYAFEDSDSKFALDGQKDMYVHVMNAGGGSQRILLKSPGRSYSADWR